MTLDETCQFTGIGNVIFLPINRIDWWKSSKKKQ